MRARLPFDQRRVMHPTITDPQPGTRGGPSGKLRTWAQVAAATAGPTAMLIFAHAAEALPRMHAR